MTLHEPYPDLDELFAGISEVCLLLSSIAADSESVCHLLVCVV
jgi:hypothetical protein